MIVTAVVGSPRITESTCMLVAERLSKELKRLDSNVEFEVLQLSKFNVKETDGSGNEFYNGKTLFDDDMKIIENQLLKSDVLIFISPVYAHSISSQMKKFIDRISYWLHIYRLLGKYGLVVSVSSNNGNEQVNTYLESMMEYLGINVLSKTSIKTADLVNTRKPFDSYIRFMTNQILNININSINISFQQASNFKHMKERYLEYPECFEKNYWENNGYFEFDDFEELFKSRLKND